MNKNLILVDFENVQQIEEVALLDSFDIKIIVGKQQNKIPISLVVPLQKKGESVDWIQVPGQGANALDFFIAYFLGQFSSQNKYEKYFIISKDTGFQPLVDYLKNEKINIKRIVSVRQLIENNSILKTEDLKSYIENIRKIPSNRRPKKKGTLIKTLENSFKNKNHNEISEIVECLYINKIVYEENGKLKYNLK